MNKELSLSFAGSLTVGGARCGPGTGRWTERTPAPRATTTQFTCRGEDVMTTVLTADDTPYDCCSAGLLQLSSVTPAVPAEQLERVKQQQERATCVREKFT